MTHLTDSKQWLPSHSRHNCCPCPGTYWLSVSCYRCDAGHYPGMTGTVRLQYSHRNRPVLSCYDVTSLSRPHYQNLEFKDTLNIIRWASSPAWAGCITLRAHKENKALCYGLATCPMLWEDITNNECTRSQGHLANQNPRSWPVDQSAQWELEAGDLATWQPTLNGS